MKKILYVFAFSSAVVACAPKLIEPEPTPEPVVLTAPSAEDVAAAQRADGEKIYGTSCTQCHEPKVIDSYTSQQWDGILPDMIGKAKLNAEKAAQVTQFVYWELEH